MGLKARILAVDDQLYFRNFVEGMLTEAGYSVVTAPSGVKAVSTLESDPSFDVVLADLVMPGVDGVEMVRELHERWPTKPVIVVVGVGEVRSAVAAMKLGAADYLVKPVERDELLRAIRSVLDQRRMRDEHARLVDENLEFMGLLSVYERALPLLGATRPGQLAADWLEVLCSAVKAEGGVAWLRDPDRGALVRTAVEGMAFAAEPELWEPDDERLEQSLLAGVPTPGQPRSGPEPSLWVPALCDGALQLVARLDPREEHAFGPRELAVGEKLGEIAGRALLNAVRAEGLERESLRDPQTDLPRRAFLERVLGTEVEKAQRFARPLALLCLELATPAPLAGEQVAPVVSALRGSVRATDILAAEGTGRFWALLADADLFGSVIMKRRLADRVRGALADVAPAVRPWLGVGAFPQDGSTFSALAQAAISRARAERESLLQTLPLGAELRLPEVGARLLEQAVPMPPPFVGEIADLLIAELASRPGDRGVLFLAPGAERPAFAEPLATLGDVACATDVFLATDSDTLPSGASVHTLPLPEDLPRDTTWIVRFGEAPPYALVAGPPRPNGRRMVFHSADRALVEDLAFRLRSEVGVAVEVEG